LWSDAARPERPVTPSRTRPYSARAASGQCAGLLDAAGARLGWCERDYENDGYAPQTWRQVTAATPYPVRDVGRYPPLGVPGQELFAAIYPGAQPGSCAVVVYVRTGPDRYQPYALLGGP